MTKTKTSWASTALNRRSVLQTTMLMGAGLVLKPGTALAQAKEIVVANWGGDAEKAILTAWGGFKDESGLEVVVDGSGTPAGKVRAMVEANNAIWDAVDSSFGDSILLVGTNLHSLHASDFMFS